MTFRKTILLAVTGTIAAASFAASQSHADEVITDNLIVDGRACIGQDCIDGENFGSESLRLKGPDVSIEFEDSSPDSSNSIGNDWRITINGDTGSDAGHFAVEDSTADTVPFRVDAGAPDSALRVTSNGNVGIKTASPRMDLQIVDGDSPAIRLEQDGSSGFTPQTWDLAGNEANFFVRDVTGGNMLPFRVMQGAGDNALVIGSTGNVGMGTNDPIRSLHVARDGAAIHVQDTTDSPGVRPQLFLENQGGAILALNDSSDGGNTWSIAGSGKFRIGRFGNPVDFTLDTDGNVTVRGTLTTGGTMCGNGCDRVFDPNYDLPSIEQHAKEMFAKRHLPNIGPTIEGEAINVTEKLGRMLNELEKAHIYIADLNEQNKALAAANKNIVAATTDIVAANREIAAANKDIVAANKALATDNEALYGRLGRVEAIIQ